MDADIEQECAHTDFPERKDQRPRQQVRDTGVLRQRADDRQQAGRKRS